MGALGPLPVKDSKLKICTILLLKSENNFFKKNTAFISQLDASLFPANK